MSQRTHTATATVIELLCARDGLSPAKARRRLFIKAFRPGQRPLVWLLNLLASRQLSHEESVVDEVMRAKSMPEGEMALDLIHRRRDDGGGLARWLGVRVSRRSLRPYAAELITGVSASALRPR